MAQFRVHHARFFNYEPKAIHCLSFDKDTERLAVSRSDGSIEIWNKKEDWFQERVIPGCEGRSIEALAWLGGRLFSGGLDGEVIEYNLLTLQPMCSVSSDAGPVWCLTLNTATSQLGAGCEDGCVVLFNIEDRNLQYCKAFARQQGRILCIDWQNDEDVIVTGGIDDIRLWSVNSGQVIQRIFVGRQDRSKETIVWAVSITRDLTIVSGDSRGKTCFWNARQGTLIKEFQSHKSAVLSVCASETGDEVYSSGVDPRVVQFRYVASQPSSDWHRWIPSEEFDINTHDVRAISLAGEDVVWGGVDTNLVLCHRRKRRHGKRWRQVPSIPQRSLVHVAKKAQLTLLQYNDYLEIWRLGSSSQTTGKDGEILPMMRNSVRLLQLKATKGQTVICSAISSDGCYFAYSDAAKVRFFKLHLDTEELLTPKINISKMNVTFPDSDMQPAHHISFTDDSSQVVIATASATLQLAEISESNVVILHTFPPLHDPPQPIHQLCLHVGGNMAAVASLGHPVSILDLQKRQVVSQIPSVDSQTCTMAFSLSGQQLVIANCNQTVFEFDIVKQEYTDWSRQHSRHFTSQWLARTSKIKGVAYNPQNPRQIFLHDEQMLCILDKDQPFPSPEVRLFNKQQMRQTGQFTVHSMDTHCFHFCTKYKYIMHLEALSEDWLVVVERTPIALTELLPATLAQKKFGT